jgi:hypothetical protein
MDAVALLHRAQEVGLRIEPMGDKLLIRGPKRAEPVVKLLAEHKAEVLAALAPDPSTSKCGDQYEAVDATQARRWRDRLAARTVDWFHGDRGWEDARRLAWGDVENEWHELHGQRWPSWQCAGCDAPLGGSQALNLPDGTRYNSSQSTASFASANAGEATPARHLPHLGSNHLALTEISYD